MKQQALFEDRVLKLKVVDSGFDVLNTEDFKDDKDIQRILHLPNKETNEKIGVNKKEFEEKVKKCYGIDKVEWIEKNWLDYSDRERDDNGIIKITDGELLEIPLNTIRCWRFNLEGLGAYLDEKGESGYMCPKCKYHDKCHSNEKTPLEERYEKLKGNKVTDTNEKEVTEVTKKSNNVTKQIDLSTTKEDVEKEEEARKQEKLCSEKEEVDKERVYGVGYCIMGNSIFPKAIYLCDEYGIHNSTLGITEEFFNHLVKDLKLEKKIEGTKEQIETNGEELHTKWVNPNIKTDEKSKELAELDKKIAEKRKEFNDLLKEKVDILKNE
jgi:hypothetical protein